MLSGGREAVVVNTTDLQGADVKNNRFSMLLSCECICFCKILNASPSICASKEEYKNLHFKARSCQHFLFFFLHFLMALASGTIIMPYNKLPSGALICEQKSILMLF